jgi:hypothetical protein
MSNPMLNAMKTSTCQSGVVLVTGLLFLLVVTIIAVTAANNSTLGLRMSASLQKRVLMPCWGLRTLPEIHLNSEMTLPTRFRFLVISRGR